MFLRLIATTSAPADDTDGLLGAKLTSIALLGVVSLLLGLLPLRLASYLGWGRHAHKGKNGGGGVVLSMLLCFGAGVLMTTTFIHMLPEVQEDFEKLEKRGVVSGALIAKTPHLLMCAGFFLMYLVEELVHYYLHKRTRKNAVPELNNNDSRQSVVRVDDLAVGDAAPSALRSVHWGAQDTKPSIVALQYADGTKVNSEIPPDFAITAVTFANPWGASETGEKQFLRVDTERPCCQGVPRIIQLPTRCHRVHHDHMQPEYPEAMPEFMSGANHHSHAIPAAELDGTVVAALRGLLIVVALGVHELFEGLAIGLEGSADNVWVMLTAVGCHKFVIAFCIGVEFVAMRTKVSLHVLYIIIFAVMSPIGIAVGIIITTDTTGVADGMAPAVLQGLATGTLLYVVFFEILERQRSCGHYGIRQFLAVLAGFLAMWALMQIDE